MFVAWDRAYRLLFHTLINHLCCGCCQARPPGERKADQLEDPEGTEELKKMNRDLFVLLRYTQTENKKNTTKAKTLSIKPYMKIRNAILSNLYFALRILL